MASYTQNQAQDSSGHILTNQTYDPYQDKYVPTVMQQNLGLVIDTVLTAGQEYTMLNWVDNLEWVRRILIFSQSDQAYDIKLYKRDRDFVQDGGTTLVSISAGTGTTFRSNGIDSYMALIGFSGKFSIKNTSANPNTYARVRIQLLG